MMVNESIKLTDMRTNLNSSELASTRANKCHLEWYYQMYWPVWSPVASLTLCISEAGGCFIVKKAEHVLVSWSINNLSCVLVDPVVDASMQPHTLLRTPPSCCDLNLCSQRVIFGAEKKPTTKQSLCDLLPLHFCHNNISKPHTYRRLFWKATNKMGLVLAA